MRTSTLLSTLILIACGCPVLSSCGTRQETSLPKEAFVLRVSSLDWKRIDTLIGRGELPHFQTLLEEGVRAAPSGEDPLATAALWASFETGKSPRTHGVLGAIENMGDGVTAPTRSISRRSMSLWQILSRNNLSVACVGLPGSWPAETVQGHVVTNVLVPNRWTETREVNIDIEPGGLDTFPIVLRGEVEPLIHAESGFGREDLSRFFVLTERDYQKAFEEPLGSILLRENPMRDFVMSYQADMSHLDIALYLRREYRPNVTAVFLELPAVVSPVYWFFVEPEVYKGSQGEAHRFRNTVDEVYRWVDECLGRVMEELGPRSTLVVLSEHGFGTSYMAVDKEQPRPFPEAQPHGVLLMRGPGLRPGVTVRSADIVDVAPTILMNIGVPIGRDLEGRPLTGAFEESFLQAHPPIYRDSYEQGWNQEERYIVPSRKAQP